MRAAMDQKYLNGPFLGSDQALGSFVSFCQQHKGKKTHHIFLFPSKWDSYPQDSPRVLFQYKWPWSSMTIHDLPARIYGENPPLDPPRPVNRLAGTCGTQFILAESTSHQPSAKVFWGLNVRSTLNMELQPVSEISEHIWTWLMCCFFACANLKLSKWYTMRGTHHFITHPKARYLVSVAIRCQQLMIQYITSPLITASVGQSNQT